jgi:MoaA/NifB/PqqE/SkfB family radical SAM enzyme
MNIQTRQAVKPLDPRKFVDPLVTLEGRARAAVALSAVRTLWFNTGTLCNLTCANCYIESSPRNDRLAYIGVADVAPFLDELEAAGEGGAEIGFTGGEPFMNPSFFEILEHVLSRGHPALVLTNAMRPMMKRKAELLALKERHGARLALRVSLDHYDEAHHAEERGPRSWRAAIEGLTWLARQGFVLHVAGRTRWNEDEASLRAGYARLFARLGLAIDAFDPHRLVLFPEMDARIDVPEISEACWGILGKRPDAMMCASSRMVVKRKDDAEVRVMPCTLLPYDDRFVMGRRLAEARGPVALNHPHCAKFCVLGGGSCSV